MKKSHIIIIVIIAAAIGIIMTTAGDASTYVTFTDAYKMASQGNDESIHVVGELKKNASGEVIGILEGADSSDRQIRRRNFYGRKNIIEMSF